MTFQNHLFTVVRNWDGTATPRVVSCVAPVCRAAAGLMCQRHLLVLARCRVDAPAFRLRLRMPAFRVWYALAD